jgi:hypothetical protein
MEHTGSLLAVELSEESRGIHSTTGADKAVATRHWEEMEDRKTYDLALILRLLRLRRRTRFFLHLALIFVEASQLRAESANHELHSSAEDQLSTYYPFLTDWGPLWRRNSGTTHFSSKMRRWLQEDQPLGRTTLCKLCADLAAAKGSLAMLTLRLIRMSQITCIYTWS